MADDISVPEVYDLKPVFDFYGTLTYMESDLEI